MFSFLAKPLNGEITSKCDLDKGVARRASSPGVKALNTISEPSVYKWWRHFYQRVGDQSSQSALTLLNVRRATFKKGVSLGFIYLYQLFKKSNICFLFSEFQLSHSVECSLYQMSVVCPGKWNTSCQK